MRIPTDSNERDKLLQRLREAVVYQIGLWDTAKLIEEMTDCDLSDVLKWVNDNAYSVDSDSAERDRHAACPDFSKSGNLRGAWGSLFALLMQPLPTRYRVEPQQDGIVSPLLFLKLASVHFSLSMPHSPANSGGAVKAARRLTASA